MHPAFARTKYLLKRKGLAIGGKYQLLDPDTSTPLLFVRDEMQLLPPKRFAHIYADETCTHELLTLATSDIGRIEMDILDAESGAKLGGIAQPLEATPDLIVDDWAITDAADNEIGSLREKGQARSLVRELFGHEVAQVLEIKVGETLAGEVRQRAKPIAYELDVDFSADPQGALDRRLGIAAAVFTALHQATEPT